MITISSRPLSQEEISRRTKHFSVISLTMARLEDAVSRILTPMLAAVPFTGLGWVFSQLVPKFSVPIMLAGGMAGLACAICAWLSGAQEEGLYSARKREQAEFQEDLARGTMQLVKIEGVVEAWGVDDLEDFEPGYVLRTAKDEYVYLHGQVIAQCLMDDLNESDDSAADDYEFPFPTSCVELEVLPGTREIESVKATGPIIETQDSISSIDLKIPIEHQFHLFENSDHVRSILQRVT